MLLWLLIGIQYKPNSKYEVKYNNKNCLLKKTTNEGSIHQANISLAVLQHLLGLLILCRWETEHRAHFIAPAASENLRDCTDSQTGLSAVVTTSASLFILEQGGIPCDTQCLKGTFISAAGPQDFFPECEAGLREATGPLQTGSTQCGFTGPNEQLARTDYLREARGNAALFNRRVSGSWVMNQIAALFTNQGWVERDTLDRSRLSYCLLPGTSWSVYIHAWACVCVCPGFQATCCAVSMCGRFIGQAWLDQSEKALWGSVKVAERWH